METVLLNPPDEEAVALVKRQSLVSGAIGNAVFDATGVRLREVPFTPERVKAALAARA